ncbi:hypothetical protein OBBRIDRAFT_789773 [Obba rivulosa]|uniref:Uncharacterized protein n=1 Tax=Obba rivulosa TaxID=1052685 RepID=A0A8E2DQH2_9APHY|nr:hypothetical protein OBBRIDRAFT_789773 [Obba rivulosa]
MRVLRARTTGQPVELPPAPDSRTVVDPDPWAPRASVGDTLEGADGRELSESYGRPGAGMTSAELHHDGRKKRKRRMQGLEVYGAGVVPRELPESEESG